MTQTHFKHTATLLLIAIVCCHGMVVTPKFGKAGSLSRSTARSFSFTQLDAAVPLSVDFSTPQIYQQWQQTSKCFVTGLIIAVSVACCHPLTAVANEGTTAVGARSVLTNEYTDPLHPLCKRRIRVVKDGTSFHYSGSSVKSPKNDDGTSTVLRGCSPEEVKEFGFKQTAFDGTIVKEGDGTSNDNLRISAGDGIHEGVWEPANTATTTLGYEGEDGIRWNDGNKWIVKPREENKVGEVIFYAYIGFSGLAGVKGVYDGFQKNKVEQ